MNPAFERQMREDQALIEAYLSRCFVYDGEPQQQLFDAMRYSLLAGGKRLRPVLTLAFARACAMISGASRHCRSRPTSASATRYRTASSCASARSRNTRIIAIIRTGKRVLGRITPRLTGWI